MWDLQKLQVVIVFHLRGCSLKMSCSLKMMWQSETTRFVVCHCGCFQRLHTYMSKQVREEENIFSIYFYFQLLNPIFFFRQPSKSCKSSQIQKKERTQYKKKEGWLLQFNFVQYPNCATKTFGNTFNPRELHQISKNRFPRRRCCTHKYYVHFGLLISSHLQLYYKQSSTLREPGQPNKKTRTRM